MALTAEVLFVNPEYMKRLTNLDGSVDDNTLVPSIILAQDLHIQQLLGTDLFEKLRSDIGTGALGGDYETLMDNYVRKATCWWTMVDLLPSLYVKIENGGLVQRNAQNAAPVSADDLHREVERARNNAKFYGQRLSLYLTYNTEKYPEYHTNTEDKLSPYPQGYDQSGFTVSGTTPFDELRYITRPPSG